jgi:hypothetical protein
MSSYATDFLSPKIISWHCEFFSGKRGNLMWFKQYRDYPIDQPLIKEQVEPGKGIVGCEMHDLNGWGMELHCPKPRKKGLWAKLMIHLFRERDHGSS